MGIEFSGFDDLINDLNNLGAIGNKIGKQAVDQCNRDSGKRTDHQAPQYAVVP